MKYPLARSKFQSEIVETTSIPMVSKEMLDKKHNGYKFKACQRGVLGEGLRGKQNDNGLVNDISGEIL